MIDLWAGGHRNIALCAGAIEYIGKEQMTRADLTLSVRRVKFTDYATAKIHAREPLEPRVVNLIPIRVFTTSDRADDSAHRSRGAGFCKQGFGAPDACRNHSTRRLISLL
jgi:hypothetical protein